ncbi:MAG: tol-pal system protein YbgF [Rhodospirillales bacterium]
MIFLNGSGRRLYVALSVFLLSAAIVSSAAISNAQAQSRDLQPLLDRLERLERDIRTLNRQLAGAKGGAVAPLASASPAAVGPDVRRIFANMEVRLGAMEEELRTATGRSEELGHQIDLINQRLDKLIGDVDYRLSVLENAMTGLSGGAPSATLAPPDISAAPLPPGVQTLAPGSGYPDAPAGPGVLGTLTESDVQGVRPPGGAGGPGAVAAPGQTAGGGILPPGSPKEQYKFARRLLLSQQFDKAEIALREFVQAHPDDPLNSNARYWLGETFYVRGDFRSAAKVFMEGYKASPNGTKAADTLFKLGKSLASLDKKQNACTAYAKLNKDFPDAPANLTRLVAREQKRNECN